jgi:hypothetical protein
VGSSGFLSLVRVFSLFSRVLRTFRGFQRSSVELSLKPPALKDCESAMTIGMW